jgi:histidine triad (HIT) family protein
MEKTVFERVIIGELPSWRLYEDDKAVAILDITPINKGHTLIIPREPFANIYELPPELFAHLMTVAQRLAKQIKETLKPDGINIIMANGRAAGQMVTNHAHIHIIPRYDTDGFEDWHGKEPYADGEKEKVRDIILGIPT